jgi:hypothetical protein
MAQMCWPQNYEPACCDSSAEPEVRPPEKESRVISHLNKRRDINTEI